MQIKEIKISEIQLYEQNNKVHNKEQIKLLKETILEYWFTNPVLLSEKNECIWWHGRIQAMQELWKDTIPAVYINDLTPTQIRKLRLLDNKIAELAEDNLENIKLELEELDDIELNELYDLDITEIDPDKEAIEDDVPDIPTNIIVEKWDIFQLWEHKIICWDSLDIETYNKILKDERIDLAHNDPPYWMKLESKGIENDNLNFNDLLQFNKDWINLQVMLLKDNWSLYIWGIDESLMDIHSDIMKPLIAIQKVTFRNIVTWNKWNWQGQNSENTRSYAIADEKCLFYMMWVQGFNNNQDNYFEGWEVIRLYLEWEKNKMWWTDKWIAEQMGIDPRLHWFGKSQWDFPTEDKYRELQSLAKKDAFKKEYNEIKKEYNEIKKEYNEIKKEYYKTRAYFNNVHDNFNNVWDFKRTNTEERESAWWHYTPKPIELCSRAILSSCPEWWLVFDSFLWSWSTLIASEKNNRRCYGIELQEKYIQVILKRYKTYTNWQKDIKCLNRELDLTTIYE